MLHSSYYRSTHDPPCQKSNNSHFHKPSFSDHQCMLFKLVDSFSYSSQDEQWIGWLLHNPINQKTLGPRAMNTRMLQLSQMNRSMLETSLLDETMLRPKPITLSMLQCSQINHLALPIHNILHRPTANPAGYATVNGRQWRCRTVRGCVLNWWSATMWSAHTETIVWELDDMRWRKGYVNGRNAAMSDFWISLEGIIRLLPWGVLHASLGYVRRWK